ncbi:hypothetical protein AFK68_16785 [Hydrocoleum sp. CS-953]|uniref:hypothetical protein n=1 Tax=Hydrocoleum sp. CS-953 TaxID=1671698 RepID=UPI000B9B8E57|nr:hypothetical protein [Hydrocoleum sp. CS-953]OZH53563.1 hypothetical protein AFK68_16785 [Hydrocoleum sp. CS-953]
MAESKKYSHKLEINDLIDNAIDNAVVRRGLVETLSDDEAKIIGGGLSVSLAQKTPTVAGFKPICPPIKPIEPVCYPIKPIKPFCPPIKICPPIVVGLIAVPPEQEKLA